MLDTKDMPVEVAQEIQELGSCPSCKGGQGIIKNGHDRKGRQVYWCKPCRKRFIVTANMPGRRMPPEQVGAAISMFYDGLSIGEVSRNLAPVFNTSPPSKATVYEWVTDYTRLAQRELGAFRPKTGDTWVADEIVIKVGGRKFWNWNVMDADTRFLLAQRFSPTRGTHDAEIVMRQAAQRAGHPPESIVTDRLASYLDGIERAFGSDSRHIQSGGIRAVVNNNLSERLQGTIRQREKVMRGLKSQETAQLVMDGWAWHYNFFRPHGALKGKTPAQAAGIVTPLKDWEMVAGLDVRPFSQGRVRVERTKVYKHHQVFPTRDPFRRRGHRL